MGVSNGECRRGCCSIHKVLILGDNRKATSVVDSLSADDIDFDIHHAVHLQSTLKSSSRVGIHLIDFSIDSLDTLFKALKPDIVFSTTSGGSYDFQKHTIDLAISASIPRFVAAEYEQDSLNKKIQERLPPSRERARVIQYLQEQSANGRMDWLAIATGCTLDQGLRSGNLGFDIKWQSVTVHGTGDERFAASSTAWTGDVALAGIKDWDDVKNQYVYAAGMVTSANDILDGLQNQTGQKWERGEIEVQEAVREAERRMDRGFPDAAMFLMEKSVLSDETLDAVRPFIEQDAKAKLGLEPEKLDMLIKKVIHDHKHHGKGGCGCD